MRVTRLVKANFVALSNHVKMRSTQRFGRPSWKAEYDGENNNKTSRINLGKNGEEILWVSIPTHGFAAWRLNTK